MLLFRAVFFFFSEGVATKKSAFHHGTDSLSTKNEAPPSVRWHQVLSIVHRTRRCWKHQSLGHGTCPAWHREDQLQLLAVVWHTGFKIWMIRRFYKKNVERFCKQRTFMYPYIDYAYTCEYKEVMCIYIVYNIHIYVDTLFYAYVYARRCVYIYIFVHTHV